MHLLVISSYPQKDKTHGPTTVGVASYTKETITNLKKLYPATETTIWSETNHSWKRNSFLSLLKLSCKLLTTSYDHLFLPHEFNMFGSPTTTIFFPLILLINRLKRKPSILILHQVVTNFKSLAPHANLSKSLIPLFNFTARLYLHLITSLSHQTVVFETFLKNRLPKKHHHKIHVIPHAILSQPLKKSPKKEPFTLLYFGYLAHYKGIDWLTQTFQQIVKANPHLNLKLLIAGGPNPNHLPKKHYQNFLKSLKTDFKHSQITHTGFVPEKQISQVFSQNHLVILPYRTAMSSSGPLGWALGFHKPFILSQPLTDYTQTSDFQTALQKHSLSSSDISFQLTTQSLQNTLLPLIKNPSQLQKLQDFSYSLSQQRSWSNIAPKYLKLITNAS